MTEPTESVEPEPKLPTPSTEPVPIGAVVIGMMVNGLPPEAPDPAEVARFERVAAQKADFEGHPELGLVIGEESELLRVGNHLASLLSIPDLSEPERTRLMDNVGENNRRLIAIGIRKRALLPPYQPPQSE